MKISTLVELAGFTCFSVAAFLGFLAWRLVPGFAVTGICLLLIGYGTEDDKAALAVGRIVDPVLKRRAARRQRRAVRKTAKMTAASKGA